MTRSYTACPATTLGWSTSGKPLLVTNVRLVSPPSPPPAAPLSPSSSLVADGEPAVAPRPPARPDAEPFFFLRPPLASGGIFWEGSWGTDIMPGIVPITLCCDQAGLPRDRGEPIAMRCTTNEADGVRTKNRYNSGGHFSLITPTPTHFDHEFVTLCW